MIAKKNSGYDLERRRHVFFQVGLLTAASFTLAAFSYTSELPGGEMERIFSTENQTMILDFEQEPEKQVVQKQPETPPQVPNNDPNPSDPNPVGNPDLQNVAAGANRDRNVVPIGPPNGGIKKKIVIIDEDPIDPFPPIPAEYIGGVLEMKKFINDQIRYPQVDREQGNQGTVYVSFVIERNGTVSNVVVQRGVTETIDREAARVVRLLNQWIPAQNAIGKVRTNAFLPIHFTLE